MNKYFVFHCSNGYCGCDEDIYEEIPEEMLKDIDEIAHEILMNSYSFAEPDGRFCGNGCYDDEISDEDYDEYVDNLDVDWIEITKEEYEENS